MRTACIPPLLIFQRERTIGTIVKIDVKIKEEERGIIPQFDDSKSGNNVTPLVSIIETRFNSKSDSL